MKDITLICIINPLSFSFFFFFGHKLRDVTRAPSFSNTFNGSLQCAWDRQILYDIQMQDEDAIFAAASLWWVKKGAHFARYTTNQEMGKVPKDLCPN